MGTIPLQCCHHTGALQRGRLQPVMYDKCDRYERKNNTKVDNHHGTTITNIVIVVFFFETTCVSCVTKSNYARSLRSRINKFGTAAYVQIHSDSPVLS